MSIKLPEATYTDPDQVIQVANAAKVLVEAFPDYDIEFKRRKPCNGSDPPLIAPRKPGRPVRRGKRDKGFRAQVIRETTENHRTVPQICEQTDLTPAQVRGVINAPTLTFDKQVVDGMTAYKFVSEEKSKGAESL